MNLHSLITQATELKASDVHLEPGMRATFRIRGDLKPMGEPLQGAHIESLAREAITEECWDEFLHRRSFDLGRTIDGARCRINVMHTMRGIGLAIRLLPSILPTVDSLNLHPDIKKLAHHEHGLVLVCGPTGCGKSSTLAALIQEINLRMPKHIVTIEQPIEYSIRPAQAFIRQREVGRDTPSFEAALHDAMRQDPDVLMVGEMRDPNCMRLTLNAAETGHLVLATVHSSTAAEALQRMVLAFPAEIQAGIAAQLADCLLAVVCQRLRYKSELDLRVPECEILLANTPIRAGIRQAEWYKLGRAMETGAQEGMWTWDRYRAWLEQRTQWHLPLETDGSASDPEPVPVDRPHRPSRVEHEPKASTPAVRAVPRTPNRPTPSIPAETPPGVLEIPPPKEDLSEILSALEKRPGGAKQEE